jgi:hypothetical protein
MPQSLAVRHRQFAGAIPMSVWVRAGLRPPNGGSARLRSALSQPDRPGKMPARCGIDPDGREGREQDVRDVRAVRDEKDG